MIVLSVHFDVGLAELIDLKNFKLTIVTSSKEIDGFRIPSDVLGLISNGFALLIILSLLVNNILTRSNDHFRSILGIVVNQKDLRISGNSNPMFNRGDFNIIDGLVDFPFLNRSLEVRVFPKFNFTVLSTSDKVLSVLVNI
jgi:hypothetical protein